LRGTAKGPTSTISPPYPIFVWRFHRRWWTQFETESRTDFGQSNHTGFKSGIALGYMFSRKKGVWVKPEIGWGRYRPYDFAIKISMLSVR
jgi:hypothetical protein